MKKILFVVAPFDFQEIEYLESKKALEENGYDVVLTSLTNEAMDRQGVVYDVPLLLGEVKADEYAAIVFVGGPGTYALFDDSDCHRLAREFYEQGKPTAAICAAPVILGRAGLLKNKKSTSFSGGRKNLEDSGASFTGVPVERDGQLITADGPSAAYAFGLAVADALR